MSKYIKIGEAADKIGLSKQTLRRYALDGKIDFITTPGGQRLFNISSILESPLSDEAKKVCYCRVSTHGQKDDLIRQINYMSDKYPEYEIISDIGSGINFNRPGIQKIIDYAISGNLLTLVVAYKDRLCRIGYDLLEHIMIKYSNTKIVLDKDVKETLNEEISNDILQIITVYSAKINGMRKYKHNEAIVDKI